MQRSGIAVETGFLRFDPAGRLVDRSAKILGQNTDALDLDAPAPDLLAEAAEALVRPDPEEAVVGWLSAVPVEALRADGTPFLLSGCASADGGRLFSAVQRPPQRPEPASDAAEDLLLRRVLDGCPAATVMCRIGSGEIVYRTPSFRRLFGRTRFAREHYADPETRADMLARLLPEGLLDDEPMLFRRADGSHFRGLCSARIVDYRGEDVIVATVTDLTELIRQKAEADALRERLSDAVESLDEGFAIYGADGRLKLFNRRYRELNGHIADTIRPGVHWRELVDATLASGRLTDGEAERVAGVFAGRTMPEMCRMEAWHRDGRCFSVSRSPTREGGFVVTRLDVTDQKRREAEAREVDEIMREVLNACPVGLVMSRISDGAILFQSAFSVEQYGLYENVADYWVDADARARWLKDLCRAGRVDGREVDLRRPDGGIVRVALSGRRVRFRGEDVVVSHAFDLSERIGMERELARQREVLHQSEKLSALGELLAGVAHELNNPLSVVVGHALMLEEEATDPAQKARVAKIGSAAERCARIVRTFLSMARRQGARLQTVEVEELLDTALEITAWSMRQAGIELACRLDGELPAVSADPDQMVQVLANILLNAENALATQRGERVITVSARHDRAAGQVVLKVKDNGPGIPEAIRSRIFEPFFTTKAVNEGTGIGLAFCHRIVEAHGGRLYVRSVPGRGASFFIRLPVAAGPTAAASPARIAVPAGLDVLVLEDEPGVAELIVEILSADGHVVRCGGSGEEGLRLVAERAPDVVLSDLALPGLDGRGFWEALRARHPLIEPRLAFITGDTMSPGARAFLTQAGRPCLEKPVTPSDLRALLAGLAGTLDKRAQA